MKKIVSLCLVAALALGLCACGGGASADKPVKLASAIDFNNWFAEGKKLSKKTGETVYFQLTGDIKVNKEGLIGGGNDVCIDLNGHTITGGENRAFLVSNSSLTLKNGEVTTAGDPGNGGVICVEGENGALTVENTALTNREDATAGGTSVGGVIYASDCKVYIRGDASVITGSSSGLRRSGGSVALTGASAMYMEGGKIQGGKAGTAGNIYMDGTSQLQLLGGSVEGGAAVRNSEITGYGGNLYVQGLASVYVAGGSILSGTADKDGGNIYLANTAGEDAGLYFISGTMDGGTASLCGGNVYAMDKSSAVRISGGTLSGGVATQGGNIYLKSAPFRIYGGTLVGIADTTTLISGGNIYGEKADLKFYGGSVTSGMAQEYGGNVCVSDSQVDIYGGSITAGATVVAEVTRGGGNFYAGRESVVRIYGGEISGGIANCMQDKENSAAGGNVMIGGVTKLEMFGGVIKDGMVYGSITRGGSVYVYGQSKNNDSSFHFYGGLIENGLLDNKMRGMCIGAYSNTKNDTGHGIARIFGGEFRYTGAADDKNKIYTIHGNKGAGTDMYLFDATGYEGLYNHTTVGPCPDASHNTVTGEVAATCLTQGCTQYTCETCGVWYAITAEPTGHTETTESTDLGVKHSCSQCQETWFTEE